MKKKQIFESNAFNFQPDNLCFNSLFSCIKKSDFIKIKIVRH